MVKRAEFGIPSYFSGRLTADGFCMLYSTLPAKGLSIQSDANPKSAWVLRREASV